MNKQDLLHHETAVCELRRVKCHSCNDIRREMDTVKDNLAAVDEKLKRVGETLGKNEKIITDKLDRNEANVKAVEENVVTKIELVQEQLNKQEESNRQLKSENVGIRKSLNLLMKQLERITQQTSYEVQAEEIKKGIAEGGEIDREPKVIVVGGWSKSKRLNSVEMFSLATRTWTQLQPTREGREGPSSVVYNNQLFVTGGCISSIEKLSLNDVHTHPSISWVNSTVKLPGQLAGHSSVVYNGRLVVIGGYDVGKGEYSDSITEISLVPPYTSKLLATMPQRRGFHGVAIFGDKVLIVGGRESSRGNSAFKTVFMFDMIIKECQELAPLPYPVHVMATVKWGDDNVMIMGGADSKDQQLNKVLMYNIKTQKSHELPNMKYKRQRCVAAVVRDTVIVMGGRDERGNCLKSAESFRFDRYSWEELTPMHEARLNATAVVC